MKEIKDEFLCQYGNEVLSTIALPERITEQYSLEACFIYTEEKRTYLLCSKSRGEHYILKQISKLSRENLRDRYIQVFPNAIDYIEDEQYSYLIRTYISGSSLYDIIECQGKFTERKTMEAAIAICDSLHYLHSQKPPILHGDIKPQNVILTPTGEYYLIDTNTTPRNNDAVAQAMEAPEQLSSGEGDECSDIYAVGMLMVYMLTGGFDITSSEMRGVGKLLGRIIANCLAFDPCKRYASALELKSKLENCLSRKLIRFKLWIT